MSHGADGSGIGSGSDGSTFIASDLVGEAAMRTAA
jgi:hypothetical protein